MPFTKGHKFFGGKETQFKKGHKLGMTGKNHTKVSNDKNSKKHIGMFAKEKHWNWQGGINPINDTIRKSTEYKLWRKAVFERDNYTCIWCGNNESGNLNADHIKPFSLYPELRFAIDNGRTLCVDCHKTTDSYLNNHMTK